MTFDINDGVFFVSANGGMAGQQQLFKTLTAAKREATKESTYRTEGRRNLRVWCKPFKSGLSVLAAERVGTRWVNKNGYK
jgi:hypothetical protein